MRRALQARPHPARHKRLRALYGRPTVPAHLLHRCTGCGAWTVSTACLTTCTACMGPAISHHGRWIVEPPDLDPYRHPEDR